MMDSSLPTAEQSPTGVSRLEHLDVLRAFAALSVCLFHFGYSMGMALPTGWRETLWFGRHGVEVFFVLSGFIIPLSMARAGYQLSLSSYGTFLQKRFWRIYPSFILSALIFLALWHASWSLLGDFKGTAPEITPSQLLSNLTFTSGLVGETWLIPIYWTLAIEVQFYLFIGLVFPILNEYRGQFISRALLFMLCTLPFLGVILISIIEHQQPHLNEDHREALIGSVMSTFAAWSALFAMGMGLFRYYEGELSRRGLIILLALAANFHFSLHSWPSTLAGLLSASWIAFFIIQGKAEAKEPNLSSPSTLATWHTRLNPFIKSEGIQRLKGYLISIGSWSFSLYLIHAIIGGRVMSIINRLTESPWLHLLGILLATAISILAAWILHRLIERPFARGFSTR